MKLLLLKVNQFLLFAVLLTAALYYGRMILIPLAFAAMLAMLLTPICRYLDQKGFHRALSCTVSTLILLLVLAGIIGIVIAQISTFSENLNMINQKFGSWMSSLQRYAESQLDIPPEKQESMLKEQLKKLGESAPLSLGKIAGNITGIVGGLIITLVFTFLMLYHKERYERSFLKIFKGRDEEKTKSALDKITHVSRQYLTGRALSMLFLFILYSTALLVIGVKSALLLSAIAAMLTIIPYVGPIVGGLFPVLMALVTESSVQPAIWVAAAFILIQAIDNYYIEPYMVGGEVNLSALSVIVAIIAGGLVWGIAGMILFIPLLSIVKIIFDQAERLKPYSLLISDPGKKPSSKLKDWFGKIFRR